MRLLISRRARSITATTAIIFTRMKILTACCRTIRPEPREHAVNPEDPYFNYFQFLPFRSQTSYSSQELTAMINDRVRGQFKTAGFRAVGWFQDQNQYGINALLVAGIAANESSWGTCSNISQTKNNLFGIAAADSNPGELSYEFESPEACIREYTPEFSVTAIY